MATYAGYKAYETPDLGGMVAKSIDKLTEAQDKKDLLQQQLDYKRAESIRKDDLKRTLKEQEKRDKAATNISQLASKATIVPSVSPSLNAVGNSIGEQTKAEAAYVLDKINRGEMTEAEANVIMGNLTVAAPRANASIEKYNAAKAESQKTGINNPYSSWVSNQVLETISPTEKNPIYVDLNGGNVKIQKYGYITDMNEREGVSDSEPAPYKIGVPMGLDVVDNASALLLKKPEDYDKEEKEVLAFGLQDTPSGSVLQESNKAYQNARSRYINRIINNTDAELTANAIVHYAPAEKKVVFIDVDWPEQKKDLVKKQNGDTELEVVEMKLGDDGIYKPLLTDEQKGWLKTNIEKSINGRVTKQVVKGKEVTAEAMTKKEKEDFVSLILKGDPGALQSFGNIGTQRKQLGSEESKPAVYYKNGILYVRGIINKLDDPIGKGIPEYGYKPIDPKSPGARQDIKEILGYN